MDRKENNQDHLDEPPRGRPLQRGRSLNRERDRLPQLEGPDYHSAAAHRRTSNPESSRGARRVDYHGLLERSSHNPENAFAPNPGSQDYTRHRDPKSRSRSRDDHRTSDRNYINRETRDPRNPLPSGSQSGSVRGYPSQPTNTYYPVSHHSTGYTAYYPQYVHNPAQIQSRPPQGPQYVPYGYTHPAPISTVREDAIPGSNNANPHPIPTRPSPPPLIPRLESPVPANDKRSSSASSNLSSAPPRKKTDTISLKDHMDIDIKGSATPHSSLKLNRQRQASKLGTQVVSANPSGSNNDNNSFRANAIQAASLAPTTLAQVVVNGHKYDNGNSSGPSNQSRVNPMHPVQQDEPAPPITTIVELFENDSPDRADKITSILAASKPSEGQEGQEDQTFSEFDAEGEANPHVPTVQQSSVTEQHVQEIISSPEDSDVEESEVKLEPTWEEKLKADEEARAAAEKASASGKAKPKAQDKDSKRETRRRALQINPILDHSLSRLEIDPKKSDKDAYKALLFHVVSQLLFPKNHHTEGGNVSLGRDRIMSLVMRGIRALYGVRFQAIIDEWRGEFKEEMRRGNFTLKSPYRWNRHKSGDNVSLTRLDRGVDRVRCSCCKRRHKVSNGIQFFGTPCSNIQDGQLDNMLFGPEEDVETKLPPRQGEGVSLRFNLGENCVQVIQAHHNLKHWERHLISWVKEKLIDRKILGPDGVSEFGLGRNKNSMVYDFTASIFQPWLAEDEGEIMEQLERLKTYVDDAMEVYKARNGHFLFKKRKKDKKSKAKVQPIQSPLPSDHTARGLRVVTQNSRCDDGQSGEPSAVSNPDAGPSRATEGKATKGKATKGKATDTGYHSDSDDYCFLDFDDLLDLGEVKESDRPNVDKSKKGTKAGGPLSVKTEFDPETST
ncbi:hypothetical protein AA313_de0202964 [Arthrobotrys entomopaga]|nr:hypothetical protein AA313_de0202964 [Arthrobotrys entomopaga]